MEELREAIEQQSPVDIYFRVINMNPDCIVAYERFLVTGIDEGRDVFIGYTIDQRSLLPEEKIITEDRISAICKIIFP